MSMIEDNTHIHTHTHTQYSGGSSGWRVEREVSDLWCKSQARYAEMQVATWSQAFSIICTHVQQKGVVGLALAEPHPFAAHVCRN